MLNEMCAMTIQQDATSLAEPPLKFLFIDHTLKLEPLTVLFSYDINVKVKNSKHTFLMKRQFGKKIKQQTA
jgi:hypothetical protein